MKGLVKRTSGLLKGSIGLIVGIGAVIYGLSVYVDTVPNNIKFNEIKQSYKIESKEMGSEAEKMPVGYATAQSFYYSLDTILNKRGGYLTNDYLPPFVMMDNIPSFERGAINALKRTSDILTEKMAYVGSTKLDDNLQTAMNALGFNQDTWGYFILSNTEKEFGRALIGFEKYKKSLIDKDPNTGQFVTRANDLREMMGVYKSLLLDLDGTLKSSTGVEKMNFDYDNKSAKEQKTRSAIVKTKFMKIDDNFYEAKGVAWVIFNEMIGLRYDYYQVLKDKNALIDFDQALAYMHKINKPYNWIMVLPGGDYSFFGNHSANLASDLSSAESNLSRVRDLLKDG